MSVVRLPARSCGPGLLECVVFRPRQITRGIQTETSAYYHQPGCGGALFALGWSPPGWSSQGHTLLHATTRYVLNGWDRNMYTTYICETCDSRHGGSLCWDTENYVIFLRFSFTSKTWHIRVYTCLVVVSSW